MDKTLSVHSVWNGSRRGVAVCAASGFRHLAHLEPAEARALANALYRKSREADDDNAKLDEHLRANSDHGLYRGLKLAGGPVGMDIADKAPKETPGQPELETLSKLRGSMELGELEAKAEGKMRGLVFEAMQDFIESPAGKVMLDLVRAMVREELGKITTATYRGIVQEELAKERNDGR